MMARFFGYTAYPPEDEQGGPNMSARTCWLDPRSVVYFEQTETSEVDGLELAQCLMVIASAGGVAEIPLWMKQSEIDRLTDWLER